MDQADFDASVDPNSALYQARQKAPNFIGPYASDAQRKYLRDMAFALQKPGEAKSWAQVFGNMAQSGVGALLARQAFEHERGMMQKLNDASTYQGGGQPQGGDASAPAGASPSASASPSAASMVSSFAPDLDKPGAAGLVGNWQAESGANLNPTSLGDSKSALGLAQWRKERRDNLVAFAQKNNASPTDPQVQQKFALVEMGLAGDKSDPGFASEARAGQALINAKTPQEATAAALMYERPAGYSAAHPENSSAYGKRLAYVTTLMGNGGAGGGGGASLPQPSHPWTIGGQPIPGGPSSAGGPMPGSATSYADAGGSQGGGSPAWPAEKPQTPIPLRGPSAGMPGVSAMAPAPGPVMAQNMQPGTQAVRGAPRPAPSGIPYGNPPIQGTQRYNDMVLNPMAPDALRGSVVEQQKPHPYVDAWGGVHQARPALIGGPNTELSPGGGTGTAGLGGQSLPFSYQRGPDGQMHVVPLAPNAPPSAAGAPSAGAKSGYEGYDPGIKYGQGKTAEGAELEGKAADIGTYRREGRAAEAKLGQIGSLRALGDQVDTGMTPMFQSLAAKLGVPLGEDKQLGRVQAYASMAGALLPSFGLDPQADAFRERLTALSGTREGRRIITDFLGNYLSYQKKRGDIAGGGGSIEDRIDRIGKLESPKMEFLPEPAAAPGVPASAGVKPPAQGGDVQRPPGVPPEAKQSPRDKHWYTGTPGNYQRWD